MASKNERRAKELGMTLREYKKSSHYKKNKKGTNTGTANLIQSILGATPKFKTKKPFEDVYTPELQAEDRVQSEALFKPYFAKQISDTMEDLNAWAEMDSINYKRTLRQGRAKMAQLGGAIGQGQGGERQKWEGEVKQESDMDRQNKVRATERQVGSAEMQKGGFTPFYNNRVGTITDNMNSAIEEQTIWNRNQRANRYNANISNVMRQQSSYNFLGKKL